MTHKFANTPMSHLDFTFWGVFAEKSVMCKAMCEIAEEVKIKLSRLINALAV